MTILNSILLLMLWMEKVNYLIFGAIMKEKWKIKPEVYWWLLYVKSNFTDIFMYLYYYNSYRAIISMNKKKIISIFIFYYIYTIGNVLHSLRHIFRARIAHYAFSEAMMCLKYKMTLSMYLLMRITIKTNFIKLN